MLKKKGDVKKPKRSCTPKRVIGFLLMTATTCGCIFAIFIIAAGQTEERNYWTFNFVKVMSQDFLITPILYLFVNAFMFSIGIGRAKVIGKSGFGKFLQGLSNPNFVKLHTKQQEKISRIKNLIPLKNIKQERKQIIMPKEAKAKDLIAINHLKKLNAILKNSKNLHKQ